MGICKLDVLKKNYVKGCLVNRRFVKERFVGVQ